MMDLLNVGIVGFRCGLQIQLLDFSFSFVGHKRVLFQNVWQVVVPDLKVACVWIRIACFVCLEVLKVSVVVPCACCKL